MSHYDMQGNNMLCACQQIYRGCPQASAAQHTCFLASQMCASQRRVRLRPPPASLVEVQ